MTDTLAQPPTADPAVARVLQLEREGRDAFLARDLARLDALWSDALLVNAPINRVHTKQQVLALLGAGVIAHSVLEASVESARRLGDLVVVMASERVVDAPGAPVVHRRATNVWQLEGGAWKLVVRHANVIA